LASSPPAAAGHRTPRLVLVAGVLAALISAGALGFLVFELREGPHGVAGTWLGTQIGGPFRLVDQNGKTVSDTDLRGKWLLVYFGYTHCPDECPTALNNLALAWRGLAAPLRAELRPVFITVDPTRDTPAVMKEYVAHFAAPIVALTGTRAAVTQAARGYRVYYDEHEEPGGASVDHSSVFYVMDPNGRFAATIGGRATAAQIAARLKQLLG
jgi:protein SCO1/2